MNRRQFVRTAGASMGAVLLARANNPSGAKAQATGAPPPPESDILALPDEVTTKTEQEPVALASADRKNWEKKGITVRLERTELSLAVDIASPTERLESVTLAWRRPAKSAALYLGDAWERAYGDLAWKKLDAERIMPWYFMEFDGAATHGFGVKTGCRAMCYWQVDADSLKLVLDTRSGGRGVRLGERTLRAAEIVARQGRPDESSFQATKAFCRMMCDKPLLPRRPMVGTLDWYYTYGKCTEALFVAEAELFAELLEGCGVKGFALVDAGWAPGDRSSWHEDQTTTHKDFGSIQKVATGVRALGLLPGLWTRVLCAGPKDPDDVRLPRERRFLDPSLPQNLERTRGLLRLFRSWGFDIIKHDFTTFDIFGRWGFEMGAALTDAGWTFRDDSRTSAEVILDLYRAVREGCGEDAHIIGCNTVSHLSAGLVEYCRVGDDSGNNLERAMKYGPNAFAFRLPQHEAFYAVDPDCVGNLKDIPWKYNRQFIRLVAESGALLEISTRLGGLDSGQRTALRDACKLIGRGSPLEVEPLDWMEKTIPARWRIGGRVVELDWDLRA